MAIYGIVLGAFLILGGSAFYYFKFAKNRSTDSTIVTSDSQSGYNSFHEGSEKYN